MSTTREGVKAPKGTKVKIGAAVGAVAVSAVILAVLLLNREDSYRTIAVEEVNGTTLVAGNGKETVSAYEGMHLYSGDDVSVQQDSDMTMVLDMDKYVYAEPGTHFWLECEGTTDDSKTVIYMDAGSILNRITDNLNDGEVYKVDTPNSTMAVRGTVFRVTVYRGEDGLVYTLLEVFEGRVQVDLKTEEGEYNGVSETFGPGEAALIRGNFAFSEFVRDKEIEWIENKTDTVKLPIAYKEIPQNTAKVLAKFIDDGDELCIGKELLMDYTKLAEHRMETRMGKESTCTEAGYEEVWCVVCNEVTERIELPVIEHEPGEWEVTKEPTCEEDGSRQKVCNLCGTVIKEESIVKTGHSWGNWETVSAGDCTTEGVERRVCSLCSGTQERNSEKVGHTAGNTIILKNASCIQDGVAQTKCSVCGTIIKEESIAKTGHSWGSWETVSEGNCTTEGVERRTCSSCGSTQEQKTGSTGGHTAGTPETITQATCTQDGVTRTKCSVCGTVISESSIAKTGHSWGNWEPVSEGDCMTEGVERRTCSSCGGTQEQSTGGGGHSMSWTVTTSATCEKSGQEAGTCSVCGETDTRIVEATGHSIVRDMEEGDSLCVQYQHEYCSVDGCDYEDRIEIINHVADNEIEREHDIEQDENGGITAVYCTQMCACGETYIYERKKTTEPNEEGMWICDYCGQDILW